MTTPVTPVPISDVDPETLAARIVPPGGAQPGRSAFQSADGARIVVDLDRHDMTAEGTPTHIGIGCTVYEVDAAGVMIGDPIPRWVHTAPIDVVARGERTVAEIMAGLEAEAIQRLLNRRAVHAELDALNLPSAPAAPPPTVTGSISQPADTSAP